MSKPKLPTYARPCASTTMSLHVERRHLGEVGMLDEPVGVEPHELAVEHRHDEQAAVGQPAEPRRLPGTSSTDSTVPSRVTVFTAWS